jgi:hypothetical protein
MFVVFVRACAWLVVGAFILATGFVVGAKTASIASTPAGQVPKVFAVTSLADESFAICTAPIDGNVEGFFMLDFETGDLSGGVLNATTSKFAVAYKYNVLKDLGFKAGQAKNPKFLLISGLGDMGRGRGMPLAGSVLYVTDSSTGTTAAYGIPWSGQAGGPAMSEFVLLDVARPRGGGGKAK